MTILERIAERQRTDVIRRRKRRPLKTLESEFDANLAPRALFARRLRRDVGAGVRAICEIKRASPTAGVLRESLEPGQIALDYEAAGAAAISVVTEEHFFLGARTSLTAVRRTSGCPVLMKDFLIDRYQLYEARALGADAVLLIAALLPAPELKSFLELAQSLCLECLVEVHNERELEAALAAEARILGVNNRDLTNFQVNLATTERLGRLVPGDRLLVSESGIKTHDDVLRLQAGPVDAILVGEALMRAADPGRALVQLLSGRS